MAKVSTCSSLLGRLSTAFRSVMSLNWWPARRIYSTGNWSILPFNSWSLGTSWNKLWTHFFFIPTLFLWKKNSNLTENSILYKINSKFEMLWWNSPSTEKFLFHPKRFWQMVLSSSMIDVNCVISYTYTDGNVIYRKRLGWNTTFFCRIFLHGLWVNFS